MRICPVPLRVGPGLCLALALALLAPAPSRATNVSGTITADTIWAVAGSPYVLTDNLTVAPGATLTIQSGVTVVSSTPSLYIDGSLVANGAGGPILFTSGKAVKAKGDWGGVVVRNRGTASLAYVTLEYAGGSIPGYGAVGGLVADTFGSISCDHCIIQHIAANGIVALNNSYRSAITYQNGSVIDCTNASPIAGINVGNAISSVVVNNTVDSVQGYGIYAQTGGMVTGNTVKNTTLYPISTTADTLGDVHGNDVTGSTTPFVEVRDGSASQRTIQGNVLLDFNLDVNANVGVAALSSLTIAPGRTVRFGDNTSLYVDGVMSSIGTSATPIHYTARNPTPARGQWGGLVAENGGAISMDQSTVDYAGGNISGYGKVAALFCYNYGTLTVNHTAVDHSGANALMAANGPANNIASFQNGAVTDCAGDGIDVNYTLAAMVTGNTISSCTGAPVRTQMDKVASISGNTFDNNGVNLLQVDGGTLSVPATLAQDTYIAQNVNIGAAGLLTVPAGRVCRFLNSAISVYGRMNVNGTSTSGVLFSTNQTTPTSGSWGGLAVRDNGTVAMTYATVEYAGGSTPGFGVYGAFVLYNNGTLTADHCTIRNSKAAAIYASTSAAQDAVSFTNGTIQTATGDGIFQVNGPLVATGNSIKNCTANPIHTSAPNINGVSGNVFQNNGTNLLRVDGDYGALLTAAISQQDTEVASNTTVGAGGSLTLPAGRSWKFDSNVSLVIAGGQLTANGTLASPVKFTANQTVATRGSWGSIIIRDFGSATMTGATVEYGGGNATGFGSVGLIVVYNSSSLTMTGSTLQHSPIRGLFVNSGGNPSNIVFQNNTVTDCSSDGLDVTANGNPISSLTITGNTITACGGSPVAAVMANIGGISGNDFHGNASDLLRVTGGNLETNATSGQDTYIAGNVQVGSYVGSPVTLTMPPGRTWTFGSPSGPTSMGVYGTLNAVGTSASPITFTSYNTSQNAGDWGAIVLYDLSNANWDYVTVAYGGGNAPGIGVFSNVYIFGRGDLTANHSTIHDSSSRGLAVGDAGGQLTWVNGTVASCGSNGIEFRVNTVRRGFVQFTTFTGNGGYPLVVAPNVLHTIGCNTFSGNSPDRLYIGTGGGDVIADATIDTDAFVANNFTVDSPNVLTIAAGHSVTFDNTYILVNGTVRAVAGRTSRVTFTSNRSVKSPGDYGGLVAYPNGAIDLTGCDFRYGGGPAMGNTGTIRAYGGTVKLRNCTIRDSLSAGVYVDNYGSLTSSYCTFQANHRGLDFENPSFAALGPTDACNSFLGNTEYGLYNASQSTIHAENNYWNSTTGPTHASNPGGSGDKVTDKVLFTPFLTAPCTPPTNLPGDVNADGAVNVADVQALLKIAGGMTKATADNVKDGDVFPVPGLNGQPYGDGKLALMDALRIIRYIYCKEPAFP